MVWTKKKAYASSRRWRVTKYWTDPEYRAREIARSAKYKKEHPEKVKEQWARRYARDTEGERARLYVKRAMERAKRTLERRMKCMETTTQ